MTERLLLTINYKNGNTIRNLVHSMFYTNEAIFYTIDKQVHDAVQLPVKTQLKNVESWRLDKVACNGWEVIE